MGLNFKKLPDSLKKSWAVFLPGKRYRDTITFCKHEISGCLEFCCHTILNAKMWDPEYFLFNSYSADERTATQ